MKLALRLCWGSGALSTDSAAGFTGREWGWSRSLKGVLKGRALRRSTVSAGLPLCHGERKKPNSMVKESRVRIYWKGQKKVNLSSFLGGQIDPPCYSADCDIRRNPTTCLLEPLRRRGLQNEFFPSLELMKLKLS